MSKEEQWTWNLCDKHEDYVKLTDVMNCTYCKLLYTTQSWP